MRKVLSFGVRNWACGGRSTEAVFRGDLRRDNHTTNLAANSGNSRQGNPKLEGGGGGGGGEEGEHKNQCRMKLVCVSYAQMMSSERQKPETCRVLVMCAHAECSVSIRGCSLNCFPALRTSYDVIGKEIPVIKTPLYKQ